MAEVSATPNKPRKGAASTKPGKPAKPARTPLVRAQGLTKHYGDFVAVDHLDLEVYGGEIFGLLGPNGAGKTTTILMLLGLSEPTEGTAEVLGMDPMRNPLGVKQRVGYLPDNVGFYPTLTGRQNLRFTARLNGLKRGDAEDAITDLLDRVGLTDAADHRVDTYSRGMRQRLGIADALVKDPEIVILDEPTIAIDPEGVREILAIIRSLAVERGAAVLLSSHLLYQVETVCDRVGIFVSGKMIAEGTKAALADTFAGGVTTVIVAVDPETEVARVTAVLEGVEGVQAVRPAGLARFEVDALTDVRGAVALALSQDGIGIWELTQRGAALDEIYRQYFGEAVAR